MAKKVCIVGGVAGGMSAAARLRRLDESIDIHVFEKGEYISYANCGLPYYIGGEITEHERLLVQTPESIYNRFRINVHTKHEVLSIDRENKKIDVRNLETGHRITETYDNLILSPGASPIKPPLPGIDHPRIFTLRDIPDTDRIHDFIESETPKKALIVGGGYIGIEMAENLSNRGIEVSVVEMADQILTIIDFEMASKVMKHLRDKGVAVYLNNKVSEFSHSTRGVGVHLSKGQDLDVDFVILSIGVTPNTKLAIDAGLNTGKRGAISVNKYLQTSDPNIYAVGDAIEVDFLAMGGKANIPLAGPANKQGRIAADNVALGNLQSYIGTFGTAIIKTFDLSVASIGANSTLLDRAGIPYKSVTVHPYDHAGYYKNATQMTIKVIFDLESGKIYGGQCVGYEGVDKRIDVISMAMQAGMRVDELKAFEQAYAPPFSSAKDPINMVGYIADNIRRGLVKTTSWRSIVGKEAKDSFILDIRTPEEFEMHRIDGAINIPLENLRDRLNEVPTDKKVIVYCRVGVRGYVGVRILMQNGVDAYNLEGGFLTYLDATEPLKYEDHFDESYDMGMYSVPAKVKQSQREGKKVHVDACGLSCPGPIMKLKSEMDKLHGGDILNVSATDPGFKNDVHAWARATGNTVISLVDSKGIIDVKIKKKLNEDTSRKIVSGGNEKTIIVFDNDLDRVIASFIIANGALAMGRKVTMFFTFWGLSVLRSSKRVGGLKKNLIEKMFGFMLPRGTRNLKLSQMNMGGMGAKMIRGLMKTKNVHSLEALVSEAISAGADLVACQMSMDLMGVKKEELIEGVQVGGVAQYLEAAEKSSTNLFI